MRMQGDGGWGAGGWMEENKQTIKTKNQRYPKLQKIMEFGETVHLMGILAIQ